MAALFRIHRGREQGQGRIQGHAPPRLPSRIRLQVARAAAATLRPSAPEQGHFSTRMPDGLSFRCASCQYGRWLAGPPAPVGACTLCGQSEPTHRAGGGRVDPTQVLSRRRCPCQPKALFAGVARAPARARPRSGPVLPVSRGHPAMTTGLVVEIENARYPGPLPLEHRRSGRELYAEPMSLVGHVPGDRPSRPRLSAWLQEKLFERRIVQVMGRLDDDIAVEAAAALMTLDAAADRPIELHLDSPDGTLEAAFILIDAIDQLHGTLRVQCRGQVGGPAIGVAAAADHRSAAPHTRFRLSQPIGAVCRDAGSDRCAQPAAAGAALATPRASRAAHGPAGRGDRRGHAPRAVSRRGRSARLRAHRRDRSRPIAIEVRAAPGRGGRDPSRAAAGGADWSPPARAVSRCRAHSAARDQEGGGPSPESRHCFVTAATPESHSWSDPAPVCRKVSTRIVQSAVVRR